MCLSNHYSRSLDLAALHRQFYAGLTKRLQQEYVILAEERLAKDDAAIHTVSLDGLFLKVLDRADARFKREQDKETAAVNALAVRLAAIGIAAGTERSGSLNM